MECIRTRPALYVRASELSRRTGRQSKVARTTQDERKQEEEESKQHRREDALNDSGDRIPHWVSGFSVTGNGDAKGAETYRDTPTLATLFGV